MTLEEVNQKRWDELQCSVCKMIPKKKGEILIEGDIHENEYRAYCGNCYFKKK